MMSCPATPAAMKVSFCITASLCGIAAVTLAQLQPALAMFRTTWLSGISASIPAQLAQVSSQNPEAVEYYNKAMAQLQAKDLQGAISNFDRAIRLDPNYAVAYFNRGFARRGLKDFQGALKDYDQAIRLNPNNQFAYYSRGLIRGRDLQDYQGAIADFSEAIRINPMFLGAYFSRARTRELDLKDYPGALKEYDQIILLNPSSAQAYFFRAGVRTQLGDKPGAIADLQKTAELAKTQQNQRLFEAASRKLEELQR
jgi:tetratricopeptide (TPR) repeat protein